MKLHLIVVKYPGEEPWVVGAWDEYSLDENYQGFEAEVAKAKTDAKQEVRIGIVSVPDTFLGSLFEPREVEGRVKFTKVEPEHSQFAGKCVEECLHPDHKK